MIDFLKSLFYSPANNNHKCTCATDKYMQRVKEGKLVFNDYDYEYLKNKANKDPDFNKHFCHCQPERSKREDSCNEFYCKRCGALNSMDNIERGK